MIERIMRAIRLDWTVFREIAEDPNAMSEAAIIVVVVTFLSSLGNAIGSGSFFLTFFVGWITAIVVGWILWAVITYFVGTALFKGQTDIPEMMRVLGYASAPQLLGLLGFIPCAGFLFVLAAWLLSLIAGFIAVREAMEFETGTAIVTVLISWVVAFVINLLILLPLTGMAITTGL
ncbi:MAG: YIP1 family protein [Anaerolineae bacterium]|jgi:hypothetical protein